MNYRTLLFDIIYCAVRPAVSMASPFLPRAWHPGKRAQRAMNSLQANISSREIPRAMLESIGKCAMLRNHACGLQRDALQAFMTERVEYDGETTLTEILKSSRPLIFATPHYGEPITGAIALAYLLRDRKSLNIFYDLSRHGSHLKPVLERAGFPTHAQLGGLAGVRAALRALQNGESLALLPDAFDDIHQAVVVPFFGRLLRVASGIAFLALRSRALIIPAFAVPSHRMGLRISFGEPIDSHRVDAADEGQATFTLMHLLFSRIEARLRASAEHWHYWELLPHVSTPIGVPLSLEGAGILRALKSKFHSLPPALQDIPELELLLE